jgi:hypothetical protein
VPGWRDYQEDAAQFFRDLGMQAETDKVVAGARNEHRVDVAVRIDRDWLSQLWIVECKDWRRPIDKLHVVALAEIINDVGADRGFLLSEIGFQSGAIRHAHNQNITLTSLADLRENAADEIAERGLSHARVRVEQLMDRLWKANELDRETTPEPEGGGYWVRSDENMRLSAQLTKADDCLHASLIGRWPVVYAWEMVEGQEVLHFAANVQELERGLTGVIDKAEHDVGQMEIDLSRREKP